MDLHSNKNKRAPGLVLRYPTPPFRLLISLAAALTAGCATSAPGPSSTREVTVLVYNIHAGKDAAGRESLARVADVVRSTGADLVLLQEVDRNTQRSGPTDQPARLAELTGYSVAFGRTIPFQGGDYGIAILSRWRITRDTLVPLTVTASPGRTTEGREQRGVLLAEVATPGGPLAVLNTHLDNLGEDVWRIQEIATLLRVARSAAGGGMPVLLGGDFNSTPQSAIHGQLRDAGFRDAWPACGQGPPETFPAAAPVRRIDYLYLSGTERCSSARVLDADASDHRPLLVHVTLR